MIHAEKQALQSLHRVLIETRLMALEGQATSAIAEALDWAELLPGYISVERDQTDKFRSALKALVESHPRFQHALHVFDHPPRPSPGMSAR